MILEPYQSATTYQDGCQLNGDGSTWSLIDPSSPTQQRRLAGSIMKAHPSRQAASPQAALRESWAPAAAFCAYGLTGGSDS